MKFSHSFYLKVLWGLSLVGLSLFSGYSIVNSVADMNFEIATMLTPYGMLNNLVIASDHYLAPFYFELPQGRKVLLEQAELIAMVVGLAFVAVANLVRLRRER